MKIGHTNVPLESFKDAIYKASKGYKCEYAGAWVLVLYVMKEKKKKKSGSWNFKLLEVTICNSEVLLAK